MSVRKKLFEVEGFEVYPGTFYVVKDKIDHDAPIGFQNKGVTKIPSAGVGETFTCPFRPSTPGSKKGVYDTGFYIDSPCYKLIDKKVAEQTVKAIQDNLVKGWATYVGGEDKLDKNNTEFWDAKTFSVYSGQSLNSNDPEDLATLYFALRSRKLAPKENQNDSKYNSTPYVVVDVNKDIKRKDEEVSKTYTAIGVFQELAKQNLPRLVSMMTYLGENVSEQADTMTLMSVFDSYIKRHKTHIDIFLDLVEETNKSAGLEKIAIYNEVKKMKYRREVEKINNTYMYEDFDLGADLKTVAVNIQKLPELKELKGKILLREEVED